MISTELKKDMGASIQDEPARPRLHLDYLDGVRAVAAIYVVLHHIWVEVTSRPEAWHMPLVLQHLGPFLDWGHFAVGVFIVLSGYCLMMPVARNANGELAGGAFGFLKRRARRILPPYYAALALSLLIIWVVPGMQTGFSGFWRTNLPAFTIKVVLSHILLLHNVYEPWAFKINGPLWSVATEWQIYFLMPLVLLPLWRRFGIASAIAVLFALGYGLHLVPNHPFDMACPWYAGLFALGAGAALVSFSKEPRFVLLRDKLPWGILAAVFAAILVAILAKSSTFALAHELKVDPIDGAMAACLLIACTRALQTSAGGGQAALVRFFGSRACAGAGRFSYSIYLIHVPLVAALHLALLRLGVPIVEIIVLMYGVGLPLILLTAYGFHCVFEKPFMSPARERTARPVASPQAGIALEVAE